MTWETERPNKREPDDNDGIAIRTQYLSQDCATSSSQGYRYNRKKTYCFALLFLVVLGLIVTTIFFGIQSYKYEQQYEMLAVRTSGSLYRLHLYGSQLYLDQLSSEDWQNAADSIAEDCSTGGSENQIDWQCLKNRISALKQAYD